jgi:hypothetical protein
MYSVSKLCYTDIFRLQELLRRFNAFPDISEIRKSYVPYDVKLYLTLWALANQDSFRAIGDRFGMLKGTSKINTTTKTGDTKNHSLDFI